MKGAREKIRKFWLWKPGKILLAVGCCGLLLLTLIPLFRLTVYAVPYYDDYNFGRFARAAMEQEQSKWAAISGALDCSRTQWYAWQGTYSSIFFMALMPAIWGEQYYFLGPVFILLLLLAGTMTFTHVILRKVLGMEKWTGLAAQAVITVAVFMFIYSAQSGFYWYNGGVHYVGMHGFGLLMLAVAICLERAEGRTATGLLYIIGFGLNVAAPGNSVRARSYVGWGYSPLESIGRSFLEGVKHLPEFTGSIVLMVMVMLLPLIWQALKETEYRFRYPGVVLLWSFCLYATGYTPSLYSLGHAGLSRTLNAVKITYLLLLFLNEIYWCGWLQQRLQKKASGSAARWLANWNGAAVWWFYAIMGLEFIMIFQVSPNQAGHYSAYGAYYYVHTGEAYNFHQEYLERVEKLLGDEDDVQLQPYHYKPWFLCMGDLSEDENNEANRSLAIWYDKDSVTLISED